MANIYVLTGPIKSGKTTRLMQWAIRQKNIDGIFQPVIEEKRFLYHIASRTLKILETNHDIDSTPIGKYKFSNESFKWAREILLNSFQKKLDWLIIDEIGPLEFEGKGLEPAISKILFECDTFEGSVVFIVRESLLQKFTEHYSLENKFELFKAKEG